MDGYLHPLNALWTKKVHLTFHRHEGKYMRTYFHFVFDRAHPLTFQFGVQSLEKLNDSCLKCLE